MNHYLRTILLVIFCALCSACGAATASLPPAQPAAPVQPAAPTPHPAPPALAALAGRPKPCDQPIDMGAAGNAGEQAANASPAVVHYDDDSNTIELRSGARTTLAGIATVIARPDALREVAPGQWLLSANLNVQEGAAVRIAAPEVRWLKLQSDTKGFVSIEAEGGEIAIDGACISSWDAANGRYDENYKDGRSFMLARKGARLVIHRSDIRYLGYNGPEAYGLAWRLSGTTGEIVDSFVSHNFYGIYSFEVDDLVMRGNEVFANVMYGIDPHTRSMRLVIEGNVAHDNGKHGIILAEECSDAIIRNNVVYGNLHHGIVLYQRSNNNLVEGNTAYGNGGHGININDSANATVRGNTVYDNLDAGIGVGQGASSNQIISNTVSANRKDGILFYSEVQKNTLRDNTVVDNVRFGIYVKSEGDVQMTGNQVTGNAVGVYLNVANPPDISQVSNKIQGNHQADVDHGPLAPEAATATTEDQ